MPAKKNPEQIIRETVATLEPEAARALLRELLAALPKPAKTSAGAGGTKGQAIARYVQEHPEAAAKEVALAVGCVPGRVYEVRKALGLTTPVAEQAKAPRAAKGTEEAAV